MALGDLETEVGIERTLEDLLAPLRASVRAVFRECRDKDLGVSSRVLDHLRVVVAEAAVRASHSPRSIRVGRVNVSPQLLEYFESRNLRSILDEVTPCSVILLDCLCLLLVDHPEGVPTDALERLFWAKRKAHDGTPEGITFRAHVFNLKKQLEKTPLSIESTGKAHNARRYRLVPAPRV